MKDIVTPVPQEEVKGVIRKCLEQAAQVNYQRLSEYAKLEGTLLLCSFVWTQSCYSTSGSCNSSGRSNSCYDIYCFFGNSISILWELSDKYIQMKNTLQL